MAAQRIKYAELEALYEMIVTRRNGNVTHYKYASIKNGKIIPVTPKQFFGLEKKITKKELDKIMDTL